MELNGMRLLEELRKKNAGNIKSNPGNNISICTEEEDRELLEHLKKNPMALFGPHCDYNGDIPFDEFYKELMESKYDNR